MFIASDSCWSGTFRDSYVDKTANNGLLLDVYPGGYGGGKVSKAPPPVYVSPTVNYNPLSAPTYSAQQLFGSAPTIGNMGSGSTSPVLTQADYNRKYGITPAPSTSSGGGLSSYGDQLYHPAFDPTDPGKFDRFALQMADIQSNGYEVPSNQDQGPSIRGITREEYDQTRLQDLQRMVSTHRIMSPAERHEYDKLSMTYAGSLERFDIVVGALAGFAGGYVPPGGTLNVHQPSPQVRTQAAPNSRPQVHGNSLQYVGETHVYAVRGPQGTYKIGESMQGVRVRDAASIRGEAQARAQFKQTGDLYYSEIRQTFPDKQSGRNYETRFIDTFRRLFGDDTLPGNKTNR